MISGGGRPGSLLETPVDPNAPLVEQLQTPGGGDEDVPLPAAPASN